MILEIVGGLLILALIVAALYAVFAWGHQCGCDETEKAISQERADHYQEWENRMLAHRQKWGHFMETVSTKEFRNADQFESGT